jgi:hypothetical protein
MVYFDRTSATRIVFDDYEVEEDSEKEIPSAWVEMCPNCKRKYLGILGENRFDDGSAVGTCSVEGCWKESGSYVDFKLDEVSFLW